MTKYHQPRVGVMKIDEKSQIVQFQYGQNKQDVGIRLRIFSFYLFVHTKRMRKLPTILGPLLFK